MQLKYCDKIILIFYLLCLKYLKTNIKTLIRKSILQAFLKKFWKKNYGVNYYIGCYLQRLYIISKLFQTATENLFSIISLYNSLIDFLQYVREYFDDYEYDRIFKQEYCV